MKTNDEIPQVAILVSTSSGWGRRIVKGILSYANEVGPWHIWVKANDGCCFDQLPQGWRGDGVIARVASDSLAKEITAAGLPTVNVADSKIENFSAPIVRTDDRIGSQMAAQHFTDRGFRNIAFVGPLHNPNAAWYAKTFQDEVEKRGANYHLFPMHKKPENFAKEFSPWLLSLPKPTGIFVWGHGFARAVVDSCMEENISVPHDIAVLGGSFDELLSYACFPTLSGILSPTEQIGYRAAEKLHRMLRGIDVPHDTTYIPPLGIMENLSTDTLAVDDPKLVQVVQFIRKHAFEPITMTHILKAVPMARRSLERRFQQAFGRSPTDEIRRIRIDKARMLLAESDLPMQEIAEACGYATYNYLTHVFKQTTNVTPRDYRKQFRSKDPNLNPSSPKTT